MQRRLDEENHRHAMSAIHEKITSLENNIRALITTDGGQVLDTTALLPVRRPARAPGMHRARLPARPLHSVEHRARTNNPRLSDALRARENVMREIDTILLDVFGAGNDHVEIRQAINTEFNIPFHTEGNYTRTLYAIARIVRERVGSESNYNEVMNTVAEELLDIRLWDTLHRHPLSPGVFPHFHF